MPVLTICNHKGGTGKTTTVIHFGAALALSGYRVLVVDLDPQGFLSRMLGLPEPEVEHSALALLEAGGKLANISVQKTAGFDLVPSSYAMTRAMRNLNKPTDVFWLKETLEEGHGYEWVLLDTAAAMTVFSLNALVASQHVLVPVTPEYQPVLGGAQTMHTAKLVQGNLNPGLGDPLVLLTQLDLRKSEHHRYAHHIRHEYGDRVLRTAIRTSASLSDLQYQEGQTVFSFDPTSRGAVDYANATDELIRRLDAVPPASRSTSQAWKEVGQFDY